MTALPDKPSTDLAIPPYRKLLLSIEEAAALFSVSPRTMHDLIKTGIVSARRFGRRVLIPRAELEAAIERLEEHA